MPFGGLFRKDRSSGTVNMSSKEQRAKLGLKVVMAQQNPEPIYDLSDCAMLELPPDTFVMCKLLQKTTLLLQNNSLTALEKGGKLHELESLEVLDASSNKLAHLPDDMSKLKNLVVLKLCNNKLKNLPPSVGELSHLQELYLSSNKLSKVPLSICALPKLRLLDLSGNAITVLPKDFCHLQKSLQNLEIDEDKLKSPPPEVAAEGVEAIMKHMCEEHGVDYVGLSDSIVDSPECLSPRSLKNVDQSMADEALHNYMSRKQEKMKAHIAAEEEFQAREQEQLANMLKDNSSNKQHLLEGILHTPSDVSVLDYERKKLAMMQEQYNIEESMRAEQAEQLEKYFATSTNKEALLFDLSTQQANLDMEVEGLVSAKERDRQKLLKDLSSSEKETEAAVQELVSASGMRSEEFVCMLQEQERELQSLLSGLADATTELRRSEVISAMKSLLMEEALAEQRRQALQEEQGVRVGALLEEADLINSHLKGMMTTRMADQEVWTSTLLKDEQCQAAAFKLLLMKCDLKRNNILRQIGQIEYELARLSWLEVRKHKFGVKYGSTTMLEQRATLADLLKSLLSEKSKREAELSGWLSRMQDMRSSDMDEEEFWLIQYQRLLSMKPAGLAEAEAQLEPQVRAVLKAANALDLTPVFAHNSVTFSRLIDLTEEEAATMSIGPATYRSLQRALQNILASTKVGDHAPSAPCEKDMPYAPSAPSDDAPSAPVLLTEGASAPPIEEQFIESECVVCLNAGCEVVFLPCGHVCVCSKCCTSLVICPLCRAPLISKILLTY
ncbi:hypothetical protein Pcinc_001987 [Petrolisthes cinctipes]|uniref:RING-type domain-containing protein n=1 Tax=Petrolisthes cinctipes TaxID=88211 RepID=A0AAE1GK70_PETCI|nr:hypothetical protein Pcinc_001987 [Petrolisthes cinctipes]